MFDRLKNVAMFALLLLMMICVSSSFAVACPTGPIVSPFACPLMQPPNAEVPAFVTQAVLAGPFDFATALAGETSTARDANPCHPWSGGVFHNEFLCWETIYTDCSLCPANVRIYITLWVVGVPTPMTYGITPCNPPSSPPSSISEFDVLVPCEGACWFLDYKTFDDTGLIASGQSIHHMGC